MKENTWYQTNNYLYTIFTKDIYVIYRMQGENPFITVLTKKVHYEEYLKALSSGRDIMVSVRSWPNWRVNLIKTLFKSSMHDHGPNAFSMFNISKYSNWGND